MSDHSMQLNAINLWIKEYRERHLLSKSDFAKICNVSVEVIEEMESGTIKYPFEYLLNLKSNLSSEETLSFTKAVTETVKEDFLRTYTQSD